MYYNIIVNGVVHKMQTLEMALSIAKKLMDTSPTDKVDVVSGLGVSYLLCNEEDD